MDNDIDLDVIERRSDMKLLNQNIMELTIAINNLKNDHKQNQIDILTHDQTLYGKDCRGGVVQDLEILNTTLSNIKWLLNFLGLGCIVSMLGSVVVFIKYWGSK